jgi:hypothetical protein
VRVGAVTVSTWGVRVQLKIFKSGIHSLTDYEALINTWLASPDIRIISRHVTAFGDVCFFYETPGDRQHRQNWQTIQETEDLDALKAIAATVIKDPAYADLRNQQQREIYLLDKYNVNSKQADTVRELLRPEMSALLHLEDEGKGD